MKDHHWSGEMELGHPEYVTIQSIRSMLQPTAGYFPKLPRKTKYEENQIQSEFIHARAYTNYIDYVTSI